MDTSRTKEQRIREITFPYYSQEQIQTAIFTYAKQRETIPRYFEGFGKRPDTFQYPSDVLEHVKKGATSFHCSEELWDDPLEIDTELSREELNAMRKGWDLLLDIDSPYLEYSKIYAKLLVDLLAVHGVTHIGIKFSGSKGFHIIIPWAAFPDEVYGQKTKDQFPEWPRIICQYLTDSIQPRLAHEILETQSIKTIAQQTGRSEDELIIQECKHCNRPAEKKWRITWHCSYCKKDITNWEGTYNNRKKAQCPDCRKILRETNRTELYVCQFCKRNSQKHPDFFHAQERFATEKLIEADLILVSSRHLFRMPYSLHEKTSLASVVIEKESVKNFQITDAKPFQVIVQDFYPSPEPEEAKTLLLQALDWHEQQTHEEQQRDTQKKPDELSPKGKKDYQKIVITHPTDDILPPSIKNILKGIRQDGRKRALFILLSFFTAIGASQEAIDTYITRWNNNNYQPLKKGYIQSQISWYRRKQSILPPNYTNPLYKELNILDPSELEFKNPVNYTVKAFFKKQR